MSDLKIKSLKSTIWSFIENFGTQGIHFIFGVILARLLSPKDYGIIGVLSIFMGLANIIVDSGFKLSIIRSRNISHEDCSTIFYTNLILSLVVSCILFSSSSLVADYFRIEVLKSILKVYAIIPILNGFGIVQMALMHKSLAFDKIAKISISSNIISGVIAIIMALLGYSYWALVYKSVASALFINIFLWLYSDWRPKFEFSYLSLKKHFNFSIKILMTDLVDVIFDNIYSPIFGKKFSIKELGFFSKGRSFADLISHTLSASVQKVSTPLLASIPENNDIISPFKKLLKAVTMLIFPILTLFIIIAPTLFSTLLGEKWLPIVPYFRILAFAGFIYPILNSCSCLFQVEGRSDLIFIYALVNRILQILILLITLKYNTIIITVGILFHSLFCLILMLFNIKVFLKIKVIPVLRVLKYPILLSIIIAISAKLVNLIFLTLIYDIIVIIIQFILSLLVSYIFLKLSGSEELSLINEIFINRLFKSNKVKMENI
ncbi:MAG: lipopolysaccharide biosynthesis protein [Mesotoga sp.]|nr:lipopolysaccharide biosynthesis protein [Mesotoga sp.]